MTSLLSQPLTYHGSRAVVAAVVGHWRRGEDSGAIVTILTEAGKFERHIYIRTRRGSNATSRRTVKPRSISTAYGTGPRRTASPASARLQTSTACAARTRR